MQQRADSNLDSEDRIIHHLFYGQKLIIIFQGGVIDQANGYSALFRTRTFKRNPRN